jgi:hypothetical protein
VGVDQSGPVGDCLGIPGADLAGLAAFKRKDSEMSRRVRDLLVALVFAAHLAGLSAQARSAPTFQPIPGPEATADPASKGPGTGPTERELLQSVQKTRDDVRDLRHDVNELRKLLESKSQSKSANPPAKSSQIYRIMRTESGDGTQKVTTLYVTPVGSETHRPPADDVPTADEILRSIPNGTDNLFAGDVNIRQKNIVITVEKTAETIGNCKFFPLVGNARLKKRHYKCSVRFDRNIREDWPIPFMNVHTTQAVVYIDHDHLIPCDGAASSPNAGSPKTNRD